MIFFFMMVGPSGCYFVEVKPVCNGEALRNGEVENKALEAQGTEGV